MEYGLIAVLFNAVVVGGLEISNLKKQVNAMQNQMNDICEKTGNASESSIYISDTLKEKLQSLKQDGKITGAVRVLRENTTMDLVEAKQYIDSL